MKNGTKVRPIQSDGVELATLRRDVDPSDPDGDFALHPLTLQIGLYRAIGDPQTWVYLGDPYRRGVEVPAEAARRLAAVLTDLLDGVA